MVEPDSIVNEAVPLAPEASKQPQVEAQASNVDPNAPNDKDGEKNQDIPTDSFSESEENSEERELGLDINSPWGWSGSDYDDFDVITVHGVRDDYKTSWINNEGGWWVKSDLFDRLVVRQVDYSYEIDKNSKLYEPNGISLHANILIEEYAKVRGKLKETEVDRPIIWICHDLGGTIVKEALSIAMEHPSKYGKIPMLTTAIIFMGTPHYFRSIDDLEDQLHKLILLPGPEIRERVLSKVKNLARQVNKINHNFLATKILDRAAIFNVYSDVFPRTPEDPPDPVTPFQPCAHFIGQAFEAVGRLRCRYIDHVDLIRGDPKREWIPTVFKIFSSSGCTIKVNYRILQFQALLLSLAPPTRVLDRPYYLPGEAVPPVVEWIYNQEAFETFSEGGLGPRIIHIHANGHPSVDISEVSRLFYSYHDYRPISFTKRLPDRSIVYFEFNKQDSRYNTISSLLTYSINVIIWRFWNESSRMITGEFTFLNDIHSWSLEDLYQLYTNLRGMTAAVNLTIFISCFDQCPENQRQWFLSRVLEEQSYSERKYSMIISTWSVHGLGVKSLTGKADINLEHCPATCKSIERLAESLQLGLISLIERRPIYQDFQPQIKKLLEECEEESHLGHIILTWVENNHRGQPKLEIAEQIGKLYPPTTENIVQVVISSLEPRLQLRAKNVFNWVKHALEPWSTESLADALSVYESHDDEPSFNDIDVDIMMGEIEKALSGIITINNRDVKFSHPSFYHAREVGIEGSPEERTARVNSIIAEACLRYFQYKGVQEALAEFSSKNLDGGPWAKSLDVAMISYRRDSMAEYAIRFWPQHYKASGQFKPSKLVYKLFASKEARASWEIPFWLFENPCTRIQRSYISTLPVFSMLGLDDLVEECVRLENGQSSFKKDCWLAITEAARVGNKGMTLKLLEQTTIDEEGLRTAIHWAAARGTTDIMGALIKMIPNPKTFEWPKSIIFQAAAAGLDDVLAVMPLSSLNINQASSFLEAPPLSIAIWRGRVSTTELMLKLDPKPDLDVTDENDDPAITFAVEKGNPHMVEALIQDGASLEMISKSGMRPVEHALSGSMYKALDALIRGGAEFKEAADGTRSKRPPPLVAAASGGLLECVRVLLNHKADINVQGEIGTALYVAVVENHLDVARLLLEYEPKPDLGVTPTGQAMLMIQAIYTKNTELVSLLIQHGAEVDFVDPSCSFSKTPLSRACMKGDLEMVKLLLENNAGINYTGGKSDAPLFTSLYENSPKVAEFLLEVEGVDVQWKAGDGMGSLHAAFNHPTIIPKLLKRGVPIDDYSIHGTALHMATRSGYLKSIEVLLENDPRPDLESVYDKEIQGQEEIGCTPLQLACMYHYHECARALLKAGANPNYENGGNDAIDILLQTAPGSKDDRKDAQACLQLLLSEPYSVPVDHANKNGPTRLHNIQEKTPVSWVQILVEAKIKLEGQDADGYTPLAVAIREGNEDVAKYLIEQGANTNVFSPVFGSILHLAVRKGALNLVKILVKSVTDIETVDPRYGMSLLYTALCIGEFPKLKKMVRYLVKDIKVSVNKLGGELGYPIIRAAEMVRSNHLMGLKTLKFLIRHKAQVNVADSQGRRAIHFVSSWTEDDGIKVLAEAGAELDVKDKFGRMPIHFAASSSTENCMMYLLDKLKDTDVNVADNDNWTPLLWAARSGGSPNIKELVSRNADVWVRGRAYNAIAEWSALKLMNFSDQWKDLRGDLEPKERTRINPDGEEEEWDDLFHMIKPGHSKDAFCGSCLVQIRGIQWKCIECTPDFSLCFKCYGNRSDMHDTEHSFEEIGPLYDETLTPPANDVIMSDDLDPELPEEESEDGTG
ncbi:putative ankyrin repeat protein [Annulohypoxylon bovei var. microspora]|nr:putative ankyrin repeat protein [Annulohypoxylon bovei var. microspora]